MGKANRPWFKRLVKDLDACFHVESQHRYSWEVKTEGKGVETLSRQHVRKKVTVGYVETAEMWTSIGQHDYRRNIAQIINSS